MAMAIWRKDEQMYTDIQDLMRTYLMHDHTPNIEQQLRQQFNEYFAWHEEHWALFSPDNLLSMPQVAFLVLLTG